MASVPKKRNVTPLLAQLSVLAGFMVLFAWLTSNALANLQSRGITGGFDFLHRSARFPISESVLPYSPIDTFGWAIVVGIINTLVLSLIVAILSTALGLSLAFGRRSVNPLARGLSSTFVDTVRNTPLVVQLLFFYSLLIFSLPAPQDALHPLPGFYLTNRGLYFPLPGSVPHLGIFNYEGGLALSPEFAAILIGLTLYSTAFAAEIIRAGIDAVPRGQWEAARSLGLSEKILFRRIVLPQALRVIVPPMTSQFVNIIKNSTLALIVGFPDLSFVIATSINQTGQAIEGILILVAAFLVISLGVSALLNAFNRRLGYAGQ